MLTKPSAAQTPIATEMQLRVHTHTHIHTHIHTHKFAHTLNTHKFTDTPMHKFAHRDAQIYTHNYWNAITLTIAVALPGDLITIFLAIGFTTIFLLDDDEAAALPLPCAACHTKRQ